MSIIESHTEDIGGVKVTVCCDLNNKQWNEIWPDIYSKIREEWAEYNISTEEPEEETKRHTLNLALQIHLQNGWFNWDKDVFFQERDDESLISQIVEGKITYPRKI